MHAEMYAYMDYGETCSVTVTDYMNYKIRIAPINTSDSEKIISSVTD